MTARLSRIIARSSGKTGELYMYGAFSSSPWSGGISSQAVVSALEEMKTEGCESVSVFINSPGGDVFEGVAILNCLKRFEGDVNVMVDGVAASAASLVAMAGDTIRIGSGAMMMVHDPATLIFGDAATLREKADMLEKISGAMVSAYCEHTKLDAGEMRTLMSDETWMTADDAVKRGFADSVFTQDEPEPPTASAHEIFAQYRKTPQTILAAACRNPPAPKEHEPMKTLLMKLGLSENATEAQAIVALDAISVTSSLTVAEYRKLAGKATDAEALGVFMAWRSGSDRVETLSKELAELKTRTSEAEVVAAIDGAIKDGKAAPAQRESLLTMGKANPDTLKAFIAAAPKVHAGEHKPPAVAASAVTLTDEEKAVAVKMNADPEKILAAKKKAIEEGRAPFAQ
jgi:ATP-dependent Clp protease protease subunit